MQIECRSFNELVVILISRVLDNEPFDLAIVQMDLYLQSFFAQSDHLS